jgi:hypothetical protein
MLTETIMAATFQATRSDLTGVRFDIFSVWNFVLTLLTLAAGGYLILKGHRAALVKSLREEAQIWEDKFKRVAAEKEELADKVKQLEDYSHKAVHDMRGELQTMMNANVKLMLAVQEKDTEIATLRGQIKVLQVEIQHLKGEA